MLTHRKYLRDDLKLCERATQRILLYSNNFLHKKLKTEPERTRRIERTRGQAALGLLKDIADLPEEKCCEDCCVLVSRSTCYFCYCSTIGSIWDKNFFEADPKYVLTVDVFSTHGVFFVNTGMKIATLALVNL